jgi:hypothetical protein
MKRRDGLSRIIALNESHDLGISDGRGGIVKLGRATILVDFLVVIMLISAGAPETLAQADVQPWQPVTPVAGTTHSLAFEPGSNAGAIMGEGFAGPSGSFEHRVYQQGGGDLPPPPIDQSLPRYERLARTDGRKTRPFTVDFMLFGRANVEGPSTNVKMLEVGGTYQHRIPLGDRFLITIKPFADVLFLSGPVGDTPTLPEQLYKVGVDFQGDAQINEIFGVSVGVTPGFWTDFIRFTGDDFRIPARALLTAKVQDSLFVAGGVAYTDNIRRNVLPAFGVIWDPVERLRVELIYPRGRLIYFLHDEWQVYGVLERGGDTWNLRSPFAGSFIDEDFEYRDVRFLLGTQYDAWKYASVFLETGVSFARKFRFDFQPQADIEPAFVLRVGARF